MGERPRCPSPGWGSAGSGVWVASACRSRDSKVKTPPDALGSESSLGVSPRSPRAQAAAGVRATREQGRGSASRRSESTFRSGDETRLGGLHAQARPAARALGSLRGYQPAPGGTGQNRAARPRSPRSPRAWPGRPRCRLRTQFGESNRTERAFLGRCRLGTPVVPRLPVETAGLSVFEGRGHKRWFTPNSAPPLGFLLYAARCPALWEGRAGSVTWVFHQAARRAKHPALRTETARQPAAGSRDPGPKWAEIGPRNWQG